MSKSDGVAYRPIDVEKIALRLPADVRGIADTIARGDKKGEGQHLGPPAPCGCQPIFEPADNRMRVVMCSIGPTCTNLAIMRLAHTRLGLRTVVEYKREKL